MSKLLILSAGVSKESNNTKLAKKLNDFLNEQKISCEIHENLYENIPFLLDNQDEVPEKIIDIIVKKNSNERIYILTEVFFTDE